MSIFKSKLFKDFSIFFSADVVNKAIPFALLPVFTYYLTPEEYGTLAIFTSFLMVFGFIIGLNTLGAITINFYKFEKHELSKFIGNIFLILFVTLIFTIAVILIANSIYPNELELSYKWYIIATITAFNTSIVMINTNLWLVEQKPKIYGLYQIGETLIKLSLSLIFVIIVLLTWKGRVYGMLIGSTLSAIVSIIYLIKRGYLVFEISLIHLKDALNYGLPLIPHSISYWLKTSAIILIIAYLVGKEETGLYSISIQIVAGIDLLTKAFNNTWSQHLYRKLSSDLSLKDKVDIVKFTYKYFFAVIIIAIIVVIISPIVINLILPNSYSRSGNYTLYLSFAAAFHGMYLMIVHYILFEKKTKYLSLITIFSSILHIPLVYILISKYDTIGAAQAQLITSIFSFLLVWYYSNKVYKMPWFSLKLLKGEDEKTV